MVDFFKIVTAAVNAGKKAPEPPPTPEPPPMPEPPPEPPEPYIEPPLPEPVPDEENDGLDIPPFLLRRADGGWVYPSLHAHEPKDHTRGPIDKGNVAGSCSPTVRTLSEWTDGEVEVAASSDYRSLFDRQPFFRELQRREDSKKTKMRARKAKTTDTKGEPSVPSSRKRHKLRSRVSRRSNARR